jgi:hypothetical protein
MADSKITGLAALTTADPANDMLPIVDVSDNSMAASGTTKRISINNILACSPTATLASATISGALGAAGLNVTGATIPANGVYLGSANNLSFSVASTLGMTLNSTGLGVGGSPQTRFQVIDSSGVCALFTKAAAPAAALAAVTIQAPVSSGFSSNPVLNFWFQNAGISNPASECLAIRTSSADRMYFDSTGNVISNVTGTAPTLAANSQMVFNLTSNTNLRISVRGTDGTTRTANITLA